MMRLGRRDWEVSQGGEWAGFGGPRGQSLHCVPPPTFHPSCPITDHSIIRAESRCHTSPTDKTLLPFVRARPFSLFCVYFIYIYICFFLLPFPFSSRTLDLLGFDVRTYALRQFPADVYIRFGSRCRWWFFLFRSRFMCGIFNFRSMSEGRFSLAKGMLYTENYAIKDS